MLRAWIAVVEGGVSVFVVYCVSACRGMAMDKLRLEHISR